MGNRVTALSSPDIQEKLGGAAYILAPSSPTYWMDSGSGEIANDNKSIYTKALKTLIDEFIEARPDIDHKRIYVGGLSNGGFMTMRLVADYPGFFPHLCSLGRIPGNRRRDEVDCQDAPLVRAVC